MLRNAKNSYKVKQCHEEALKDEGDRGSYGRSDGKAGRLPHSGQQGRYAYDDVSTTLRRQFRRKLPSVPIQPSITEYSTSGQNVLVASGGSIAKDSLFYSNRNTREMHCCGAVCSIDCRNSHHSKDFKQKSWNAIHWLSCLRHNRYDVEHSYVINNFNASTITTHYSNSSNQSEQNRIGDNIACVEDNELLHADCFMKCNKKLDEMSRVTRRGLLRFKRFLEGIFSCSHRGSIAISTSNTSTNVTYLGNVTTILYKGKGSTEVAVRKIWKKSNQGRVGIPMFAKLDSETLTLSCHQAVVANGIATDTSSNTTFQYRKITYCNVDDHLTHVVAWIYRHESKLKSIKLCCHAMLMKSHRKACKMTEEITTRCHHAHSAHQRKKMHHVTNHMMASKIPSTMQEVAMEMSERTKARKKQIHENMNQCENKRKLFTILEKGEELI